MTPGRSGSRLQFHGVRLVGTNRLRNGRQRSDTTWVVLWLAVVLLSGCAVVAGWYILHSRAWLTREAAARLEHVSRIVASQLSERIRLLDHILAQDGDAYLASGDHPGLKAGCDKLLATQVRDIGDAIRVLGIVGADGTTLFSSRGPGAPPSHSGDRSYFKRHRDQAAAVLLWGPVRSRSDGRPSFYLTRRIVDAQGRFRGVVFANIDPAVFERDLARMGLPEAATARLLTPDGRTVAQVPPAQAIAALPVNDIPTFAAGVERGAPPARTTHAKVRGDELTYRIHLRALPLFLNIELPSRTYLEVWYGDVRSIAIIMAVVAASLIVVLAGLYHQLRVNDARAIALVRTREQLEAAQSLALLGSWRWIPDGNGFEISTQLAGILGVADAGALLPRHRLWRAIHPADRRQAMRAWRDLFLGLPLHELELRAIRPDGAQRWVSVSARLEAARDTRWAAAIGTVLDITQRRTVEEERRRWADAFENAAYGISITDATHETQLAVNPAYAAMHGRSVEELVGMPVSALYAEEEADRRREMVAVADRTGRAEFDTVRVRRDGSRFPARVCIATVDDAEGRPRYRVATVIDITERRAIEQQLAQAQKMEAIGNLTGGLAHDFNNLLGVVIGNLDLLADAMEPASEQQGLCEEALAAALRGADLTQRLLAFGRRQPLRPAPTDINRLITDTALLLRRLLGTTIALELRLTVDLRPATVDPVQLEAAVANLVRNARDAMPRGGRLTIATALIAVAADDPDPCCTVAPGAYVAIEVTDTGEGMSPAVQARVFEPFFTTKPPGKGSGLGLSTVFGFANQSGGHVAIDSAVGRGTVVRLYLPYRPAGAAPAPSAPPPSCAHAGGGSETILLVEDNPEMRGTIRRQLTEGGYVVLEADSAGAAMAVLHAGKRPDLLLTDVVMAGELDGIDLVHAVAARWPGIRALLMSGFPEGRAVPRAQGVPPLRLLGKPFRRDELMEAVRESLDVSSPPPLAEHA